MIVKRIEPLSLAKVAGLLYGIFGFIAGCFIAIISLARVASEESGGPVFGALFGVGAVIFLPTRRAWVSCQPCDGCAL